MNITIMDGVSCGSVSDLGSPKFDDGFFNPWKSASLTADAYGRAKGSVIVAANNTLQQLIGNVVVMEMEDVGVACGSIEWYEPQGQHRVHDGVEGWVSFERNITEGNAN